MSRLVEVITQEALLLQILPALVRGVVSQESTPYSSTIEDCLTELVRVRMRALAAAGDNYRSLMGLLEQACNVVEQQLANQCSRHGLQFDLAPYLQSVQETLKFPGREMQVLQERLRQAQRQEQVRPRQQFEVEAAVSFEIIELGLRHGQLKGLVAKPLVARCYLNLEQVQEFPIEGDWFPYAIFIEDMVFVVNAEGLITLDTDNFSSGRLERAYGAIESLARQLYTRGEPPRTGPAFRANA